MKNLLLFGVFIVISLNCLSQKAKSFERVWVALGSDASTDYPILFLDKTLKKTEFNNKVYGQDGTTLISQQKKSVPDWSKAKILTQDVKDKYKIANQYYILPFIRAKYSLFANLSLDGEYLMIDFAEITKKESQANKEMIKGNAEKFTEGNLFAIKFPKNLSLGFTYTRLQVGVVTIPFKIYQDTRAPDDIARSPVETDVNPGLYVGLYKGKRFFKRGSDGETLTTKDRGWSFNIIGGLNKLELTEKNILNAGDTTAFTGNVASLSLGVSIAYHYNDFSIFPAYGMDIPLSDNADQWVFRQKPWFGLGIGFELF